MPLYMTPLLVVEPEQSLAHQSPRAESVRCKGIRVR
jgi:hypothetical protein